MFEKYVVEGVTDDNLIEIISASPCMPFIRELNFKYGLKVLKHLPPQGYRPNRFLMTESSGAFAVATVYTDLDCGEIVYHYNTPFYEKQRGADREDRQTIHSKKLSTLMATLKREEVITPLGTILKSRHLTNANRAVGMMDSFYGNTHKRVDIDGEQVHGLLNAVLSGNTYDLDLDKCKELLDNYNKLDKIKAVKIEQTSRFFDTEFYAIGADDNKHLVIGTVKRDDKHNMEVVKPFQRVKDLEVHEMLKPILLMHKLHLENKGQHDLFGGYLGRNSGYIEELDMIDVCTSNYIDAFNMTWTFVPCSSILAVA